MLSDLAAVFWFIVALVFLVLWLTKKTTSTASDQDNRYGQGFWDGYRDLGTKIQEYLNKGHHPEKESIQRLINVGFGGSPPPSLAPHSETRQMVESIDYPEPVVALTPEQIEAEHEKESLKNFNVLLFMGSLLLVAAGAAFVAAAMPNPVKLFGVWVLTFLFYSGGMALHFNSSRLKPAAVAFVGTGLALVPFAGVALHELGDIGPAQAWFITSLIGVVGYFFAAVRLSSQVVSYLTLAFVISLASSFSESLGAPLVWSFVLVIGVGLVFNMLALAKPNWLPKVFAEPIENSGQIVTPITLLASLVMFDQMDPLSYELVFGVATLHYIVTWLQTRKRYYTEIIRALAHMTTLFVAWDITKGDQVAFGLVFLFLTVLQQAYSFLSLEVYRDKVHESSERIWTIVMQVLQLFSISFWVGAVNASELTSTSLAVLALSSLVATFIFRKVFFAIPALLVSIVLPFIIARSVISPALDFGYIEGLFIGASIVLLLVYPTLLHRSTDVKMFMIASSTLYVVVAGFVSALLVDWGSFMSLLLLGAIAWAGSYVFRQVFFTVIGNIFIVLMVGRFWAWQQYDLAWLVVGVAGISAAIFYAAYWMFYMQNDKERSITQIWSTWVVLGIGSFSTLVSFQQDIAAASAWMIVALAVTIGIDGWIWRRVNQVEAAAYVATFGLQRLVGIYNQDLNIVFYGHWWALVIAAMAFWRGKNMQTRLIIAMSFISFVSGIQALADGGEYQLLFLIEHIALLVVGALLARSWAIWWGLIGASLAVLYFLKDIAWLAFAFLGLLVIGIVIWRLNKVGKHN